MVNIEFNLENVKKCKCPGCPVQAKSKCAMDKLDKLSSMGGTPKPEDVPGVYCSTGKATCSDLDPDQMCQCATCDIYKGNNLGSGEPNEYFCLNGKAR